MTAKKMTLTQAAAELEAVRYEFLTGGDGEALLARVDAVGGWLASQKVTPKATLLLREAGQLADKLKGGTGNLKLRVRVIADRP